MSSGATPRRDPRGIGSITFNMIVFMNLLTRPFEASVGKRHGITLSEWRCLIWLAAMPGASGQDTARGTGMDRMSVSRNLRALEAKGAVARETDPEDRKRHRWSLTQAGWRIHDDVLPGALERDTALTGDLGAKRTKALMAALIRAQARLADD